MKRKLFSVVAWLWKLAINSNWLIHYIGAISYRWLRGGWRGGESAKWRKRNVVQRICESEIWKYPAIFSAEICLKWLVTQKRNTGWRFGEESSWRESHISQCRLSCPARNIRNWRIVMAVKAVICLAWPSVKYLTRKSLAGYSDTADWLVSVVMASL